MSSIPGSNTGSMSGLIFDGFRKQASFFLREKIKAARLALTDVTSVQLLVEEATNGNPEAPDARTLKIISRAAFEVDDYYRIMDTLHRRFLRFDRRSWRVSYNALIVLEHLLTHGPERIAEEFQCDRDVISQMESFQHVDEKGFNWGLNMRKKSDRILRLLEKGPLLKEERDRARKISREIQGFGSFSSRASQGQESFQGWKGFGRCNSEFTAHTNQEDLFAEQEGNSQDGKPWLAKNPSFDPRLDVLDREEKPLLSEKKNEDNQHKLTGDYYPFADSEHELTNISLLSTAY